MELQYRGHVIRDADRHGRGTRTGNINVRRKDGIKWLNLRHFPHDKNAESRERAIARAKRWVDDQLLVGQTVTVTAAVMHLDFFGIKPGMAGVVKDARRTSSSRRSDLKMQVKFEFDNQTLWMMEDEVDFPEGHKPQDHGL